MLFFFGMLSAFLKIEKTEIKYNMKQIYYVIRTLLRGHGSNVIKILSLALGLTMSILLFARVAFEQSFDKCFKDYDNLYQSALCRAQADWLVGINATRLFSILYHKTLNVGRVLSPTLNLLVERDGKITMFHKEKYHIVHIGCGGVDAESERISDAAAADTLKTACEASQAVCVSLKKEKKTALPPKLFDLTSLQREANRVYGFTAKQTLDYAQSLYEKRFLTYPRTDSNYLTEDMAQTATDLVAALLPVLPFMQGAELKPEIGRVINSAKVSDHHAIIPTAAFAGSGFDGLPESEKKLMSLVCCKLLCAVAAPQEYETVTAVFDCGGKPFTDKGKTILIAGWKDIDARFRAALKAKPDEDSAEDAALPELNIERPEVENKEVRLEVSHLSCKSPDGINILDDVSFEAYSGEILGIAGISGCGQKELLEAIAGLQKTEDGSKITYVNHQGEKESLLEKSPRQIRECGVALSFVPEDRLGMGLVGSMGMPENMLLRSYDEGKKFFISNKEPKKLSERIKQTLNVQTTSINAPVRTMSGGNVQKVLVGREIANAPSVLMTAYAVRGLDINTSYTIYDLLNEQKKKGVAVIYVGEDLDVLLALSDRILVLCGGKENGILDARKTTKEEVGLLMTNLQNGGADNE